MKQMLITGMSHEQSFTNGKGFTKLENAKFFLVINNGEHRIPISAEAASEVLEFMSVGEELPSQEAPYEPEDEVVPQTFNSDATDNGTDEDEVDQF